MTEHSIAGLAAALALVDTAGVSVALFAALRLLGRARRGGKAEGLLALLLIILSANVAHGALLPRPGSGAPLLLEPLQFLLPVGVAWHLRALRGRRVLEALDLVYLLLALAFAAASFVPALLGPRLPSGLPVFSLVMWLALALSAFLLLFPLARDLHRYRAELEARFSSLGGLDAAWLRSLLVLTAALFA
ncbi:MAG TPA: hypothetical protein VFL04_01005, partial [Rectinemataceae bacterium]|nr:hypothetical protein [Rectinemataceae bacterium]